VRKCKGDHSDSREEKRSGLLRKALVRYRFCRHEPGAHVILTGTGSLDHLKENIAAINKPPLPEDVAKRLRDIFARVDCVTGN